MPTIDSTKTALHHAQPSHRWWAPNLTEVGFTYGELDVLQRNAARKVKKNIALEVHTLKTQHLQEPGDEGAALEHSGVPDVQHASLQQQRVTDPDLDVVGVGQLASTEVELAVLHGGSRVTQQQQAVDEHVLRLGAPERLEGDAEAVRRPPEVAPAGAEDRCPHGVLRRQEAQNVLEDGVRQRADPVLVVDARLLRRRALGGLLATTRRHDAIRAAGTRPSLVWIGEEEELGGEKIEQGAGVRFTWRRRAEEAAQKWSGMRSDTDQG